MTPQTGPQSRGAIRAERLLISLASLAAMYIFFSDYLPPFKHVRLWSDIGGYHYPLQRFAFQALKEGRFPLWDPSIYCGISLIGNVQAALLYPPTWMMYAAAWHAPRLPFKALEVFTLAHVWLAWMLAYMWLRARGERLPAILGAAVFACSGYMLWQTLHPGALGAVAWMPLGFWGIDESVARRDWRPLWKVAVASALAFLAGYPAAWIVNCVIFVVYALGSRLHLRAALAVSVSLAASGLLFMVQLLPSAEARSMMVLEQKYGLGAYGIGNLLLTSFVPNWFNFNPGHPTDFEPGGMYLYLGIPALFAVAWAIRRRALRPYVQPFLALAVALAFADPPPLLLHAVERIPALDDTMQPGNFYGAFAPMAALITTLSLNDFLASQKKRRAPAWMSAAASVALGAWSLRQLWIWRHGGRFATRTDALLQTLVALALFSVVVWCVRQTAGRQRILITALLLFAVMTDYKVYGSARWFNAIAGDADAEDPAYGIGGVDDAAFRAMSSNRAYREVTDDLLGPYPLQYRLVGLSTPEGFDPFLPAQYKERIERWTPFQTNRLFNTDVLNDDMLQTFAVRYVLVRRGAGHDPALAASPNFRRIGREDIYCHVYEYLKARPAYRWENEGAGTATLVTWLPERRELTVRSERGGRFVLVEQYFPGWHATVDGRPAPIERWNGAFQSIRVSSGEHHVTFEYLPVSLKVGAAISLLAFLALVFVVRSVGPAPDAATGETERAGPAALAHR